MNPPQTGQLEKQGKEPSYVLRCFLCALFQPLVENHTTVLPHVGVSRNRGPQNRPQCIVILTRGTAKKGLQYLETPKLRPEFARSCPAPNAWAPPQVKPSVWSPSEESQEHHKIGKSLHRLTGQCIHVYTHVYIYIYIYARPPPQDPP